MRHLVEHNTVGMVRLELVRPLRDMILEPLDGFTSLTLSATILTRSFIQGSIGT